MQQVIKFLQKPLLKICLTPLSTIGFGLIVGMSRANQIQWLSMLLLIFIVLSGQLVDHFFYLKYDRGETSRTPLPLLIVCEAVLLVSSAVFLFRHHWLVGFLLGLYLVYLHVRYFPFNFAHSVYDILLSVLFNGLVLNCIAYFSQVNTVTTQLLWALVPAILVVTAVELQTLNLELMLMRRRPLKAGKMLHTLSLLVLTIAVILGFVLSRPSHTFYIVQVLYVVIVTAAFLPLMMKTKRPHEAQNKLNYLSSANFCFTLLYALSYLF